MLTIASDLKYPYGSYNSMKLIWEIWVIPAFLHLMLSDVFNFRPYGKMALKTYPKNNFQQSQHLLFIFFLTLQKQTLKGTIMQSKDLNLTLKHCNQQTCSFTSYSSKTEQFVVLARYRCFQWMTCTRTCLQLRRTNIGMNLQLNHPTQQPQWQRL